MTPLSRCLENKKDGVRLRIYSLVSYRILYHIKPTRLGAQCLVVLCTYPRRPRFHRAGLLRACPSLRCGLIPVVVETLLHVYHT